MPRTPALRLLPVAIGWRVAFATRWVLGEAAAIAIDAVAALRFLHWLPRRLVVPLERALLAHRGQGLFDAAEYLARNTDVRAAATPPLRHYLRHGWAEGRAPNARFDDRHYRAIAGLGPATPVSALGHFLARGRRRGLSPLPGVELGALDRGHPELGIARIDGYRRLAERRLSAGAAPQPDPAEVLERLKALPAPRAEVAKVDVIIPVFRGRAETLNTLVHVLGAVCEVPFAVLVVNDCSPDAALAADLEALAAQGRIELLVNEENLGFAGSINRGMARHPDRDVLWLNADTEVHDGWLDRLRSAAHREGRVATVTPLTNNGTICSYPRFDADNPAPLETSWAAIDRMAAQANAGQAVETPTAVGFATYVPRAAIEAVGCLDAAAFGRGYGEENDFSQRAEAAGWRNLIACDVFVHHFGATSFGPERADRVAAAMRIMARRHPRYLPAVRRFRAADPLSGARQRLDLARLEALKGAENILVVTHRLGGGTKQHVDAEIARLTGAGASVFVLSGGAGGPGTVRLSHARAAELPALAALEIDGEALWRLLASLEIARVEIHHLVEIGAAAATILVRRMKAGGLPWVLTVHDYFAICPRINLVDARGLYCGEPGPSACQRCLIQRGSRVGRPAIRTWRAAHGALLRGARRIRVPDADVAERLARHFPGLGQVEIVPHEDLTLPPQRPRTAMVGRALRVAVIGAIGPAKGIDAVLGLARHLRRSRAAMAITVIGYTRCDAASRAEGISVTGPYLNDEVQGMIATADPDVIWIPSLWPETYCYTLSHALQSGRPVAAFDIGAQARRLRAAGRGHLIALDHAFDPSRLEWELRIAADPPADQASTSGLSGAPVSGTRGAAAGLRTAGIAP